jgi:exopolyphosphatase/guanosine-5'-triphosphate,3'-diphosphate pyrophosphatase
VHAIGVPLHVLDHEEEASLTLIGVTEGRPVVDEIVVVDIGGGSSEFVTIGPERRARAAGIRIGAATLTSRLVAHDPPTDDEVVALRTAARAAVTAAPEARPQEVVVVGGTASNLARLVADRSAGERLGRADLEAAFRIVVAEPADEVAAAHGIRPARARILAAGAAVVDAILDRYGADEVRVVERGIREGVVLATGHAGAAWRDRLENLAHGWVDD